VLPHIGFKSVVSRFRSVLTNSLYNRANGAPIGRVTEPSILSDSLDPLIWWVAELLFSE